MKNLYVRATTLYITLFVFAATVAQAAVPRTFDPSTRTWWQAAKQTVAALRSILDVLKLPIG